MIGAVTGKETPPRDMSRLLEQCLYSFRECDLIAPQAAAWLWKTCSKSAPTGLFTACHLAPAESADWMATPVENGDSVRGIPPTPQTRMGAGRFGAGAFANSLSPISGGKSPLAMRLAWR
jgi:hypothetical protein